MKIEIRGLDKLTPITQRRIKTTVKRLKGKYPLDRDLVLTFKECKCHGYAWTSKGKHRIEIKSDECKSCIVDSLIHEWAHFVDDGKAPHSNSWGIAYAKSYRAAIK